MNKQLQTRYSAFIANNADLVAIAPIKLKLLDTGGGNTKVKKSEKDSVGRRFAGLSLKPSKALCPGSGAAGCLDNCLDQSGRGVFPNVADGRYFKQQLFLRDRELFDDILRYELENFQRLCERQGVIATVRLNVLSDVDWLYIIEAFPGISFYDYTKIASRTRKQLPDNYKLIFSYSARKQYAKAVSIAWNTDKPIAVVFRSDKFPAYFNGRRVINGDANDWVNANSGPVVVGLKAKGAAAKRDQSGFVVDVAADVIAIGV